MLTRLTDLSAGNFLVWCSVVPGQCCQSYGRGPAQEVRAQAAVYWQGECRKHWGVIWRYIKSKVLPIVYSCASLGVLVGDPHLHSVVSISIGSWNFAFTHSLLKAWGCWWVTPTFTVLCPFPLAHGILLSHTACCKLGSVGG